MAYITAVNAIQAATNLALGLYRNMKTPLMIIPIPITNIPPTPASNNYKYLIFFLPLFFYTNTKSQKERGRRRGRT